MIALVTGGGGFLGGAITRLLLARGDSVRSFSRGDYPMLRAAGVDVVLVKRYFSGEEALFLEALRAWFGADGVC